MICGIRARFSFPLLASVPVVAQLLQPCGRDLRSLAGYRTEDGFTDSPPFMATDAFTLQPAIPEEIMVPLIKNYTIAFWKKFLEGDGRYMRYLTPGYANRNGLEAVVKIE